MIMVTGANGQLASLTLQELAVRKVPALGGSRTPAYGQRHLDFDDPTALDLTGVSTLVLVSAGYAEDDRVIVRHRALLDAAVRDRVAHVIYTSLTGTGSTSGSRSPTEPPRTWSRPAASGGRSCATGSTPSSSERC